ncbi:MAG: tetratricopeptide repeat protein, partial [Bacteroidia bacterium]|nr:tetratricopeptide repeat protein [Bacteroidia bacterium]
MSMPLPSMRLLLRPTSTWVYLFKPWNNIHGHWITFRKTIDIEGPSPEVYCSMGAAYENLEQYDLGLKYYQKAAKLDAFYDEAWFGAGSCLEKQEKWYQALHFFNKAIKLNSQSPEYWKAAAHAEFKIGNTISSISAYEEASHFGPADKEIWLNLVLYIL